MFTNYYLFTKQNCVKFCTSLLQFYNTKMAANRMKCTVAVCQLTVTNNKEENYNIVQKLVGEAASQNAKIVFLPEACDYIASNKKEMQSLAEKLDGSTVSKYKSLAKKHDVWLSIGGVHMKKSSDEEKLYNSHILIDNNGDVKAIYEKLHLYDVDIPEKNISLKESNDVFKGTKIVPPIETPAGLLGLSICYDLRFPELGMILRKKGAQILTYPSAFTSGTGKDHWEVLLRARAIENQCYVIAAAQYGKHNPKRFSYGQAMIVDPWGRIVTECPKYDENVSSDTSVRVATIDIDLINQIRLEMPVFQNRRNDIYKLEEVSKMKVPPIDSVPFYNFSINKIPSPTVFYRSNHSFAFTNIRCVVPGHVLVSSLRIAKRLPDLNSEEIADLFQTVAKVQKVLEEVHNVSSSTICIQDGAAAGQTVSHVHCHILPRKSGDFKENDEIYEQLARHDKPDNEKPIRNTEDQIAEATLLRNYFQTIFLIE